MATPVLPPGMHVFERGWLSSNCILFTGAQQTSLVDSGYCTHSAQTVALVEGVLQGRPLDFLLNTHLHSDHCGGNAALQARFADMETHIPPGQAPHVARWDPIALTYLPTGQQCPAFTFTQTLKPGAEIQFGGDSWQSHAAPGHDPHSLVFFNPVRKILISADALWENGFGVVFPELEGARAFDEVAATLGVIEKLGPLIVVPGHGPVFYYTPQVLVRAFSRLDAFVKNPRKHAQHAAKVLLKFKLLEVQSGLTEDFRAWALSTSYLSQIREKFFADIAGTKWIDGLCEELVRAGVARYNGPYICNA